MEIIYICLSKECSIKPQAGGFSEMERHFIMKHRTFPFKNSLEEK